MITDAILTFIYNCISGLIDLMPAIDFQLPEGSFELLNSTFSCLGYLLPMPIIAPILAYIVARESFRMAYAVWLVIKSYIPTISGS